MSEYLVYKKEVCGCSDPLLVKKPVSPCTPQFYCMKCNNTGELLIKVSLEDAMIDLIKRSGRVNYALNAYN